VAAHGDDPFCAEVPRGQHREKTHRAVTDHAALGGSAPSPLRPAHTSLSASI
jgi:hypothetical protein